MSSPITSEIEWISFFKEIGFDESESDTFAAKFFAARIRKKVVKFLNDDDLVKIGIEALGDRKSILLSIEKKDDVMRETPGSLEDNNQANSLDRIDVDDFRAKKREADQPTAGAYKRPRDTVVNLSSLFPKHIVTKQFSIRKTAYIAWTNTEQLRNVFRSTLRDINLYFKTYCLPIPIKDLGRSDVCTQSFDLLKSIKENEKTYDEANKIEAITFRINVIENDYPILTTVNVSNEILLTKYRLTPSSSINHLGTQHVRFHPRMISIDTASSSSSIDSNLDESSNERRKVNDNILLKRIKTCQIAKYKQCVGDELPRHQKNNTEFTGNQAFADVLIFISEIEKCQFLAKYLGFICVENAILDNNLKANIDEVLQIRTSNKNAYVWRLIQSHINIELMSGCSNVCLTSNYNLFINIKSVSKCVILKEFEDELYSDISKYANFVVHIGVNDHYLIYISSVAKILTAVMNLTSEFPAIFYDPQEKKYYNVDIPIATVIPQYVLNFFSHVLFKSIRNELSFDSI